MPYGVSKRVGGDTPGNDARMERLVQQFQQRGMSKLSAIKLAKSIVDGTVRR